MPTSTAISSSASARTLPRPALVVPERGCIAYERLPGVPLLDLPAARQAHAARPVGRELGRLLRPGGTLLVTAPFCSMTHFARQRVVLRAADCAK